MRKSFSAFAILLFSYSCLLGDDSPRFANSIILYQQGFVLESLSGYGFLSTTYSPIFNIGSGNPASLTDFNQFSIGFSHQANTKMDFIGSETFQRVNNLIPQSAGMVYPFRSLRIGVGLSQKYSSEIRDEDILVIVIDSNLVSTEEYTTAILKNSIYSMSALASYQFTNLIAKADQLSLGIQTNMNLFRRRQSIYYLTTRLSDEAVNWKFGFCYTYHTKSIEKLQLGIAYESKINFSGYYEDNPALSTHPGAVRVPAILTFPAKLKLGFLLEPTATFGIYNDFIYNFWDDMFPDNKNKLDLTGGVRVRASARLSASAGYYAFGSYAPYLNLHRNGIDVNDAVFISGGLVFTLAQFDIHLVLADSHLFSGEWSKQTIGKMGIGFHL